MLTHVFRTKKMLLVSSKCPEFVLTQPICHAKHVQSGRDLQFDVKQLFSDDLSIGSMLLDADIKNCVLIVCIA